VKKLFLLKVLTIPLLCILFVVNISAQTYPIKPIKLIVPFAPGGPIDQTARIISQTLSDLWAQPVVIENRTGANGAIAAESVARSPADGYSLLFSVIHHTVLPSLKIKLSYDFEKDFIPITSVAVYPIILVVNSKSPIKNIQELINLAKTKSLTFGHSGYGGGTYLAAELFNMQANVELKDIPYKGSAPAMADLLGGHVDVMFSDAPTALSQIQSGKLRALALSTSGLNKLVPNLPTFAESGFPKYNAYSWGGISVVNGTPKEIVSKLNHDIVQSINEPSTREKLLQIGAEPLPSSREQYASMIQSEILKWAEVVNQRNIKIN
jgi:tripartite-type tricarboxylate transporter receptor subunit TctC